MPQLSASVVLDAPAGPVWTLLRDFAVIGSWHPVLSPVEISGGLADRVGVCGRCFAGSPDRGVPGSPRDVDRSQPAGSTPGCVVIVRVGTMLAWGWNGAGELGDGSTVTVRTLPVRVRGLTNATSVSANNRHSLAVTADGTVMVWGSNHHGQLGNGTFTNSSTPVLVADLSGVQAVSAGSALSAFSIALTTTG